MFLDLNAGVAARSQLPYLAWEIVKIKSLREWLEDLPSVLILLIRNWFVFLGRIGNENIFLVERKKNWLVLLAILAAMMKRYCWVCISRAQKFHTSWAEFPHGNPHGKKSKYRVNVHLMNRGITHYACLDSAVFSCCKYINIYLLWMFSNFMVASWTFPGHKVVFKQAIEHKLE